MDASSSSQAGITEAIARALDSVGKTNSRAGLIRRIGFLTALCAILAVPLTMASAAIFSYLLNDSTLSFGIIGLSALVVAAIISSPLIAYCVMAVASLREARTEMSELVAKVEAADRSKSEFLANMSHEIRTPLDGVLGMVQVLESRNLGEDELDIVGTIRESGNSLMTILNDVLDFSKIEAGKLEVSETPGDIKHCLDCVKRLFDARADEKALDFELLVDPDLPRHLSFDPTRVQQCVSNLVSNAIKFTKAGKVTIAARATALEGDEHEVSIAVSDSGIGMDEATLSKLFSAFTQADGSTTRQFGGTGLGLAISKKLAGMMGGDIVVSSQPGTGSTFTLTFTARRAEVESGKEEAASAQPQSRHEGLRILLVDDNAVNRKVVTMFLLPMKPMILEAENGEQALERLSDSANKFDLVLLDVHMPVMDGKEAIRRIRSSREEWSRLPVIALTADAMSGEKERFLAMGMSGYTSKPINKAALYAEIDRVMAGHQPVRSVA